MNDNTPPKTTKNKAALIYGLVAVVFVGIIAAVSMPGGLDKALVERELQKAVAAVDASPQYQRYGAKLAYDSVEIKGGFTSRFAVVNNPRLTLNNKGKSMQIATAHLEIHPLAKDLSSAEVRLSDDITATEEGKETAKISFPLKPSVTLARIVENSKQFTSYSANLENGFTVTAEGQQGAVAYDPAPEVSGKIDGNGVHGESKAIFKNVKLSQDKTEIFNSEVVSIVSKRTSGDAGNETMSTQLEISNFMPAGMDTLYGKMGVKLDMDFSGNLEEASKDMAFKVKTFTVNGRDFTLNVTGDVASSKDDPLPVGVANLSIKNFEYVYNNFLKPSVDEQTLSVVDAIIAKASGIPVAELKDLSIDFKREKGGTSYIGKSTFEEMAALVMPLAMRSMTSAPASAPVEPEIEDAAPASGGAAPVEPTVPSVPKAQ